MQSYRPTVYMNLKKIMHNSECTTVIIIIIRNIYTHNIYKYSQILHSSRKLGRTSYISTLSISAPFFEAILSRIGLHYSAYRSFTFSRSFVYTFSTLYTVHTIVTLNSQQPSRLLTSIISSANSWLEVTFFAHHLFYLFYFLQNTLFTIQLYKHTIYLQTIYITLC